MRATIIFNHFFANAYHTYQDACFALDEAHILTLRLLNEMRHDKASPVTELDYIAKDLLESTSWGEIQRLVSKIYVDCRGRHI